MIRSICTGLFAISVVLAISPARADTLRCRSSLISTGDSATHVIGKCGEPDSRLEVSEPVMVRSRKGYTYQVGTTSREIWRYRRAPGKFPALLTFEGGVLKKLEFEK